jgi:hypothetical protein
MTDLPRLQAEVDAELEWVRSSADPADGDEPERGPYEVRLRNLRDAVVAAEKPVADG